LADKYQDRLNIENYVSGLGNFIVSGDTPLTIGVQGPWGSGKTSLINLLKNNLERTPDAYRPICLFVNAWEHSLLQGKGFKTEITLSLLKGLLEAMRDRIAQLSDEYCEGKRLKNVPLDGSANIMPTYSIDAEVRKEALSDTGPLSKALGFVTAIGAMVARQGLKIALGQIGDLLNVESVSTEVAKQNQKSETILETASMAKAIRDIRRSIAETVSLISLKTPYKRFVIFIDDLDRVSPEVAVEILDVTKNIFDISGCVFVLAIDYEVVVKGLAGKFGERSKDNEHEFRQYFDKIIQIPFHMPVGAYDKFVRDFLLECLKRTFNVDLSLWPLASQENLKKTALATTDGIPRSLKRIVNTMSLLRFVESSCQTPEMAAKEPEQLELESQFIIIALNIAFPEISKRLMAQPLFTGWNYDQLAEIWALPPVAEVNDRVGAYGELFDEEWEKVVFGLCQQSFWLKSRAAAVSTTLNCLRQALRGGDQTDGNMPALTDGDAQRLFTLLESIRIVSVEDNLPSPKVSEKGVKNDQVTQFCRRFHELLYDEFPDELHPQDDNKYAKREGKFRTYTLPWVYASLDTGIKCKLYIFWSTENCALYIGFDLEFKTGIINRTQKRHVCDIVKDSTQEIILDNEFSDTQFYEVLSENFTMDRFKSTNPERFLNQAVRHCQWLREIGKNKPWR
jgi:hypothetical protein